MRKVLLFTVAAVVILTQLWIAATPLLAKEPEGKTANISASGNIKIETGEFFSSNFANGQGNITITATDTGGRVTPLEPHDYLVIDANLQASGHNYVIAVRQAMIEDPLGRWTTWWGVGLGVEHHGISGIGTNKLPSIKSDLAAFGFATVTVDGKVIAVGAPAHVMTASEGIPGMLELDIGDPDMGAIPGLPDGHLRVIWDSYQGDIPSSSSLAGYLAGFILLIIFIIAMLLLNCNALRERKVVP